MDRAPDLYRQRHRIAFSYGAFALCLGDEVNEGTQSRLGMRRQPLVYLRCDGPTEHQLVRDRVGQGKRAVADAAGSYSVERWRTRPDRYRRAQAVKAALEHGEDQAVLPLEVVVD